MTETNASAKRRELKLLGARIKEIRQRRKLTQTTLAESLALSVAYVSLIERGGRNPPITTVVAIARALEVQTGLLMPDG